MAFLACIVAYKILKSKAYKLFAKGWNPPDVASQIGASLRSTQRWYQEFLNDNPDFAMVGKMPVMIVPIDEARDSTAQPITENPHQDPETQREQNDWLVGASELVDIHLKTHGAIREKLARILCNALDATEVNFRAIHVLSQCLCRHTEIERESSFLDMLEVNAAFKRIEQMGYLIINPSEQQE